MVRRSFTAVRALPGFADTLRALDAHPGPAIVCMTHTAWWDPILTLILQRALLPSRTFVGPMDRAQLEKFAFFRKIGVFGVDPDNPASLDAMGAYLAEHFRTAPRAGVWITPQGRFADVRTPIVIRPGVSALCAHTPGARVVAIAVEYGFWFDQHPEVFVAAHPVEPAGTSTTDWHRAITAAMTRAAAELASAVQSRDPSRFVPVVAQREGRIHPVYNVWLRLRGRSASVRDARHAAPRGATPTGSVR
jgi:hypothetical protein